MNGPIKKPTIGLGLGALEVWSIIFGLIVVVGVLLESGPEFWQSIRHLRMPSRVASGGAMVALGVFGEVAIGVFIARSAKREQIESSERIAKAEQATAEANLERKELELTIARRTVKRFLDPTEEAKLIEDLSKHAGQRFTVIASMAGGDPLTHAARSGEQMGFAQQLDRILRAAGWLHEHALELDPGVFQGITVSFPSEDIIFSPPALPAEAAYTLCQRLSKLQIGCQASEYRRIAVPLLVISVGLL